MVIIKFSTRYGRQRMVVLGTWAYLVIGVGSSWLPLFSTLLVARFLLGMLHAPVCFTSYILGGWGGVLNTS